MESLEPSSSDKTEDMMLLALEKLHEPLGILKELSRCLLDTRLNAAIRNSLIALMFRVDLLEGQLHDRRLALDDFPLPPLLRQPSLVDLAHAIVAGTT